MNIDIIRIFAFVFITMLHTLNRQYGLDIWMIGYGIISIGVNLFILISGYLLLDKTESIKTFLKKRLFNIIPLFIIFNVIYTYFYKNSIISLLSGKSIAAPHFWYIYMILGLYIITPWLRKVLMYAEKETLYVIILWFLYNVLNPYLRYFNLIEIPFSNFPITGFLGYYLLGYYFKKYKDKLENISYIYFILIYCTGLLISVLSTKYVLHTTGKRVSEFFDKNSIGTFIMTLSFFSFWLKYKFKNRINFIKTVSDSIYFAFLIHIIILNYVIKISDELIFKSVVTVVVSILAGILYNYIKKVIGIFLKKILYKN